jgi:hypothetical protein
MVEMSILSAGLAHGTPGSPPHARIRLLTSRLGMPVRPDLLGQALETYKSFVPISTALRLCHRFGTGPAVHFTNLPIEILYAVEDLVFESLRSECTTWIERFEHFESRCEPLDHELSDWVYEAADEATMDAWCESCLEAIFPGDCEHGCLEMSREKANELAMDQPDWLFEECREEGGKWEDMIKQSTGGAFCEYDIVSEKIPTSERQATKAN